jgi:tetratricopeptide (TPR) repeat protein
MHPLNFKRSAGIFLALLMLLSVASSVLAQSDQENQASFQQAKDLCDKQRCIEALPILEKLLLTRSNSQEVHYYYATGLLAKIATGSDETINRPLRIKAKKELAKSIELGNSAALTKALMNSIPDDGSASGTFSDRAGAEKAMRDAEASFARGNMDEAFANYQNALKLDPTIYEAALFSGDVFVQKEEFEKAEFWYQKAITIDPNRETAYRYSATPLMKQKKYELARDRYVEAFIVEPYNRFSVGGISQWAQLTGAKLGHPKIDVPTDVKFDEKGDAKIELNMNVLNDDGSMAWIAYGSTRTLWHKERFAKTFPGESVYRHSLMEEAEALRSVITLYKAAQKKPKNPSPALVMLQKLDDEGLVVAYFLLAIPDKGIARDHAAYLKQNRDKLRQYVVKYVIAQ